MEVMEIKKVSMPRHTLTKFEIQTCYQNGLRFQGVYARDNFPKTVKNGAYIINLDEYADVGIHWIALHVKNIEVIYFGSFGVKHVPKKIKIITKHNNSIIQ